MSCHFAGWPDFPSCEPPGQRHHVVPQQRIKYQYPRGALYDPELGWRPIGKLDEPGSLETRSQRELLDDPRNIILICWGHHQLVEGKRIYPEIPEPVWEFAEDFGFTAGLVSDHDRRAERGRGSL